MTGVNMLWYNITDYIGYGAIAICLVFAVVGLVQLIQRRSLLKVDKEILALGGLFAVTIGFYVLFEKVVINCRPILMDGETTPEPSFPSSHTVLITVVMIALMMIIENYTGDLLTGLIKALCVAVTVVTVGGRLYCGAHWFTDIVGGLLLSTALLFVFAAIVFGGDDAKAPAGGGAEFSVIGADRAGSTYGSTSGKTSGSASGRNTDKKTGGKSTAGYKPKH
jgi:undecaprenyl-diphosphatase